MKSYDALNVQTKDICDEQEICDQTRKTVQHHPKPEIIMPRVGITKHIANIFEEGELIEESNVHFLHIANLNQFKQHYVTNMLNQNIQANYMFGMRRKIWQ